MKEYFGGWYFKCRSEEGTVAVISAMHRTNGISTASIQVITDDGTWNIPYPITDYSSGKGNFPVTIGNNSFSSEGMILDISSEDFTAKGEVKFGPFTPIKGDIMGPFRFVPFMECRHSVISMRHTVDGELCINGKTYIFKNGKGYIEGDRGTSFPERYVWTHAFTPDGSLMLSVATIPIGPICFTGIISSVVKDGREYRIATYRGARKVSSGNGTVTVKQGKLSLTASLIKKNAYPLKAPASGAMVRTIRESASCIASYVMKNGDDTVMDFTTDDASFEYELGD